jgi:protein gp37
MMIKPLDAVSNNERQATVTEPSSSWGGVWTEEIIGGERGPQARPMKEEWVLSIQEQTERQSSAFFFKQWGTWGADGIKRNKHKNGKMLMGEVIQQMPMKKVIK